MTLKIKSFAPCSDWQFQETSNYSDKKTIIQIAGFAVIDGGSEDDFVIGMVAESTGEVGGKLLPGQRRLSFVPRMEGKYVHRSKIE